jgi:serine/threonine protein kinase
MAAKLGDFGVSRGFSRNEISKGIVSYYGTPYYWSPERLKGKSYN